MAADYRIGIIGAGFAGMATALRLLREGEKDFVIFERAAEVGGTWRDNTYPGCACDVKSALYSLSDAPNPHWNALFAGQEEIWKYMLKVADEQGLRQFIRFNIDITEAGFNSAEGYWEVRDNNNQITTVRSLIAGLGPLNRPKAPDFSGIFNGKIMHSAQWDKNFDLQGKRVAVIGTGASAIQLVPAIASTVGQLYVFQRTAAWLTHRHNKTISSFMKDIHERFPFTLWLRREGQYWINEFLGLSFTGNKTINRIGTKISLLKLKHEVHDPETRKKLTPEYTLGCKRVLRSDDYWPAFNRDNVHLVTDGIASLFEGGIETVKGERIQLDVIIHCTGFNVADFNYPIKIVNADGTELFQTLRNTGGAAYKGTVVSGFPNFFILMGPNTGLGHNSVVHIMESQLNYIIPYLRAVHAHGTKAYATVRSDVQQAYFNRIQEQLKGTVWSSGCSSWYLDANGHNSTLWPRLNTHFRKELTKFSITDLDLTA